MVTLIILCIAAIILGVCFLVIPRKITLKLFGLLCAVLGALLFVLYLNLNSYTAFTQETLVAKLKVKHVKGELYDMELTYTPVANSREGSEEIYLLKGNQWMIDGDILKWKPALNLLGFKTAYKITRILGRYLLAGEHSQGPLTLYTINGGTGALWLFFHTYQRFFPFVEAVYGNAAYAFPDEKAVFGIYVTTSGFIIKKLDGK